KQPNAEAAKSTRLTHCESGERLRFAALFDHLVGLGEQGRREGQAERLGGLHVDHELEFGRRLNRQVRWSRPIQDPSDVACRSSNHIGQIGAVAEETASLRKFPREVYSRQTVPGCEINDRSVLVQKERTWKYHESAELRSRNSGESRFQLVGVSHRQDFGIEAQLV